MTIAHDDTTLNFYSAEAAAYTAQNHPPNEWLERFMSRLPRAGAVLELGCGGGQDSERMIATGFAVTPTDGNAEIAAAAQARLGRTVSVLLFDDLDAVSTYDGVWANACLLHVPREKLPAILQRIRAALKQGGVFYASFKSGSAEGRDSFGRYFNFPDETWLREAYGEGWKTIEIDAAEGSGYDRRPTHWLHVCAIRA